MTQHSVDGKYSPALQDLGFTVFYVVGRPRTGSSFVGDWIAARRNILNAGEVWQTMREFEIAGTPSLKPGVDRWGDPTSRKEKRREILADPFWSEVLARKCADPYAAIVATAKEKWPAMVDCSKTDLGVARYKALGCKVIVIHTVRAFSSWSKSVNRYRIKSELSERSTARLLVNYIRLNRHMSRYRKMGDYHKVPLESLDDLERVLPFAEVGDACKNRYERHEMFGTENFHNTYSRVRATPRITWADRFIYALIGF